MTVTERQARHRAKLKAAAASNDTGIVTIESITAWWKAAGDDDRIQLCDAIGGNELAELMDESDNDAFLDYMDEYVTRCLESHAESWGYQKIEAGS